MLEVSPARCRDEAYFEVLVAWMRNPKKNAALLKYLRGLDLAKLPSIGKNLQTGALDEQKEQMRTSDEEWWYRVLRTGRLYDPPFENFPGGEAPVRERDGCGQARGETRELQHDGSWTVRWLRGSELVKSFNEYGRKMYGPDRWRERDSAQVGKLVNNLILWACMSANREGLMLGEALGVDPEILREALLSSSAQNWSMEHRAEESGSPWAEKDMMIVLDEADRARLSLPVSGVVKEAIKQLKIERGDPMPVIAE